MRALLCLALVACWSSTTPPPAQPRPTLAAAVSQPTTAAAAPDEDEHVDDVDSGDETALNSKRWKYAAFFNRLKRKIAATWDPVRVWNALPATYRSTLGTATRVTTTKITLDAQGTLVAIAVVQPSGAPELDAEALHSVQTASPFEKPPSELLASTTTPPDTLAFQFAFYFEVGSKQPTMQLVP